LQSKYVPIMKFIFISLIVFSLNSYSQDDSRVKSIDSLVNITNRSKLSVKVDSLKTDGAPGGISSQSYITSWRKGSEIKKYVNKTHIEQVQQNGTIKKVETILSIYYNRQRVIKIEQSMISGSSKNESIYYYYNDKPVYYSPSTAASPIVSRSLLASAKDILKTLSE